MKPRPIAHSTPSQLDAPGLLASLMHNVPGAIYRGVLDSDWTMELIGDEIERISGYPAGDFMGNAGRTFASIIHPEDREQVEQAVHEAVSAGEAFNLEYRIVRADGAVRWVLERGLRADDGQGRQWLDGVIFDITGRRQAEERARRQEAEAARVAELEASRARIVQASDAARRRIERDLHDGAQQRLVLASLMLGIAQRRADDVDDELADLVRRACFELKAGLAELRELARGIHPPVLSDRGLAGAIEALATCSPVPVELDIALTDEADPAVESAIYFTVAEALTNVAKYAGATGATVRVHQTNGVIAAEISDDGCGGAEPGGGSGLQGLDDRLGALGGKLELESPQGAGTLVRARVPRGTEAAHLAT
jgi:PAS domain S-box-containing protein